LRIHALTGDDRVVTIPVGGADRFEHVQELKVFEALLGGPVSSLEIRDRDGRTPDFRARLMAEAERELHVFELDSIESYLLNPVVIHRVVGEIRDERGLRPTPPLEEIQEVLDEALDGLRQATEDRGAERYVNDMWRFEHERVSVADANAIAREFVEDSWGDRSQKLRVVSGKKALARLRESLQDRYGVNFGNERLAEAFESAEIDGEVITQLQRIAKL
jgi:hypothetical protein